MTEEEKRKTLLQNGDLLFVEGNGSPEQIGRVAVWRNEIVPCVHQNHLIKARFNMAKMLPMYAMNYFMTQKGREQIREKAVSTSGLYKLSVYIVKTNYPAIPGQNRSWGRSNRGIIDSPTPLFIPFCRFRYRSRGQIYSHQYLRTSSTNDPFLKWFSYASRMMRIAMSTSPF